MTEYPTYPYPPRTSEEEFVKKMGMKIEPLVLNEEVDYLDRGIFKQIEPLRKRAVETHTVYPDFFTTEMGWRIACLVYLNPQAKEKEVRKWAAEKGIKYRSENDKRLAGDKFFEELLGIAANEEKFQKYIEEKGIEIPPRPETREEAAAWFYKLKGLAQIPYRIRTQLEDLTEEYAKEQFFREFEEKGEKVEGIENPYRINRLVNPRRALGKIEGYRRLKREIKKQEQQLGEEGNLAEGKRILLRIYRRWLNILIAENYSWRRVLLSYPRFSPTEKRLLKALGKRGGEIDEGRTAERINHFLQGVGIRRGKDGLWETIPEVLEGYGEERLEQKEPEETEEYQRYNAHKVSPEQAKKIAEAVLKAYGIEGWTVYISPTASKMSITYRERGRLVKRIVIGEKKSRGLVDVLTTLAHEIEGHVLQRVNAEKIPLGVSQKFPGGISGIFLEAGAMHAEEETKRKICGMGRPAKPYYYLALRTKRGGGSFKDCFVACVRARHERGEKDKEEQRIDFLRAKFTGQQERPEQWRKAWGEVLRIFRNHTPLNDTSGWLPASAALEYLEQEIVSKGLFEKGLGKILAVSGVNPWWLEELMRLGVVDLEKVKEPQFIIARQIWPKIKEVLDRGGSLEEAVGGLEELV